MGKIIWKILIYGVLLELLTPNLSFALAVWDAEKEQISWFTSSISSLFSTEMWLKIIFAVITILVTIIISKLAKNKMFKYLERTSEWEGREEMIWVITRSVNITILVIGTTITLSVLGIDLGIFMWWIWFWLGFTLKSFLTNFVAWIMMVTQWFYHIGDMIKIEWKVWHIKKINSLFTSVEQFDGVLFYVPNGKFMEENVENFHANDKRRIDVIVGVDYKTDILKAKKVMLQVVEQFPNILKTPSSDIIIEELGNSSIGLKLRFWISSKDSYFEVKSNVSETVNQAFKQYDISIAFPQMTISNRTTVNPIK